MWVQTRDFTEAQLERFKALQRQVYVTLQEVAETLRPGVTERAVAREIDALIVAAGFENCHKKHIGKVLGHRVTRSPAGWLASRRIWGLSPLPHLRRWSGSVSSSNRQCAA